MLWLLAIVLDPFATDLIAIDVARHRWARTRCASASTPTLQILANLAFLAMIRHLVAAGLQSPDCAARPVARDARAAGSP